MHDGLMDNQNFRADLQQSVMAYLGHLSVPFRIFLKRNFTRMNHHFVPILGGNCDFLGLHSSRPAQGP